jgi:hypothetical protein
MDLDYSIDPELYGVLFDLVRELILRHPDTEGVMGEAVAADPAGQPAVYRVGISLTGDDITKLNATVPSARPPFEWLAEIMIDLSHSDELRHYLLKDDYQLVFAFKKEFYPVSEPEVKDVINHLRELRDQLHRAGQLTGRRPYPI